jgi:hypothetical protein
VCERNRGAFAAAAEAYTRAIALEPERAAAHAHLGYALRKARHLFSTSGLLTWFRARARRTRMRTAPRCRVARRRSDIFRPAFLASVPRPG